MLDRHNKISSIIISLELGQILAQFGFPMRYAVVSSRDGILKQKMLHSAQLLTNMSWPVIDISCAFTVPEMRFVSLALVEGRTSHAYLLRCWIISVFQRRGMRGRLAMSGQFSPSGHDAVTAGTLAKRKKTKYTSTWRHYARHSVARCRKSDTWVYLTRSTAYRGLRPIATGFHFLLWRKPRSKLFVMRLVLTSIALDFERICCRMRTRLLTWLERDRMIIRRDMGIPSTDKEAIQTRALEPIVLKRRFPWRWIISSCASLVSTSYEY